MVEEPESPFEFEDTGVRPQPQPPEKEEEEPSFLEPPEDLISFEEAPKSETETPSEAEPEEDAIGAGVVEVETEEPDEAVPTPEPTEKKVISSTTKKPSPLKRRPLIKPKVEAPPKETAGLVTEVAKERPAPPPVIRGGRKALVAAIVLLAIAVVFGYLFFNTDSRLKRERKIHIEEVNRLNAELQQLRIDLGRKLDEKSREVEDLKNALNEANADKAGIKAELQTVKSSYKYMKEQYEEALTKVEEVSRLRNEISILQDRIKEVERERDRLKARAEDVRAQLDEARRMFDSKVKELRNRSREISALKERLRRLEESGTGANKVAEKRIQELQRMLEMKDKDIKELMGEIEEMRKGSSVKVSGKSAVVARVSTLENMLKRKRREVALLQERLMRSESERKKFTSPIKTIKEWVDANNTRDIMQVAKYYSSTSNFWKRWTGKRKDLESLRREFRAFTAKGKMRVAIKRIVIEGDRTVALMDVIMESASGSYVYAAKMILVRENDEWKIEDEGF